VCKAMPLLLFKLRHVWILPMLMVPCRALLPWVCYVVVVHHRSLIVTRRNVRFSLQGGGRAETLPGGSVSKPRRPRRGRQDRSSQAALAV
jgi:hypothetical protein